MKSVLIFLTICWSMLLKAQPLPDTTFHFEVVDPLFNPGEGPLVLVDEAHNNIHTKSSGLSALTNMLEDDGFVVKEHKKKFSKASLKRADILVINNPLHDSNMGNWTLPCPSAFTPEEIEVLVSWVKDGGRLFLTADHMPIGGAVQELAKEFGVEWNNGFAMASKQNQWPPSQFSREDNTLRASPVTTANDFMNEISIVSTYTGSAFRSEKAQPFLVFDDSHWILEPETAWKFTKKTKRTNAKGWYQGACLEFGKGKMVLMGEAAMFTARVRGKTKIGMSDPDAPENAQLAMNIFRYLAK